MSLSLYMMHMHTYDKMLNALFQEGLLGPVSVLLHAISRTHHLGLSLWSLTLIMVDIVNSRLMVLVLLGLFIRDFVVHLSLNYRVSLLDFWTGD